MPSGVYHRKVGRKYKERVYPVLYWLSVYQTGKSIEATAKIVGAGKNVVSRELNKINAIKDLGRKLNTHEDFLNSIKISDTGCWEWAGLKNNKGYGQLSMIGKERLSHRYSYKYYKGGIGAYHVCHHCDNPCCVNPDHLFLGTRKDNMIDMTRKGRHGTAKLNPESVLKVRELKVKGSRNIDLAKMFSVSEKTIRQINSKEAWKWVG